MFKALLGLLASFAPRTALKIALSLQRQILNGGLKKLVFLITDCDFGGAEQMLFEICQGLKNDFQIQVWVLKRKGYFARLIEEMGVPVKNYGLGTKMGAGYYLKLFSSFAKFART